MTCHLARCAALSVFLAVSTPAQTAPSAPSAPSVPKDFGPGFRQFTALGLPDIQGAEYCTMQIMGRINAYSGLSRFGIKGDAWILPGATGPTVRVVLRCGAVAEVWRQADLQRVQVAERKEDSGESALEIMEILSDRRVGATWRAADLQADLARVMKRFDRATAQAEEGETVNQEAEGDEVLPMPRMPPGPRSQEDWELQSNAGELFLFAALVYAHGQTNEANRLCAGLFERAGGPREVIKKGIEKLATEQLQQALDDFEGSGDWAAYAGAVEGVATRFARAWSKGPVVQRLAARLRERAEGRAVPSAEGLKEEDLALVRELAEQGIQLRPKQQSMGRMMQWAANENWLLDPPEVKDDATAAERLLARGPAAVPVLAALLSSRVPLPPQRNAFGMSNYRFYSSSDREEDYTDERVLEQALAALPGPMTLGAWARTMLSPVLQQEGAQQHEVAQQDDDEVRATALAWYEAHQGQKPSELAREALRGDDTELRQAALNLLVSSTNAADQALVEQTLLEVDAANPQGTLAMLEAYALVRGTAASSVVERVASNLAERLREQAAAAGDRRVAAQMEKWITNQFANIRALTSGETFSFEDAVITWGAQEDENFWSSRAAHSLEEAKQTRSAKDLGSTLLRLAVSTQGVTRARILSLMPWVQRMPGRGPGGSGAASNRMAATDQRAEWTTLLQDLSPAPDQGTPYFTNVSAYAAFTYAGLFDDAFEGAQSALGSVVDDAFVDLLRRRALARLEGASGAALPGFPSADQVPEARRTALRKAVLAAAPDAVHDVVSGLAWSEKLWLREALAQDDVLRDALLPGLLVVRSVTAAHQPELAGKLSATMLNRRIDVALLTECLTVVSNGEAHAIYLTPGDPLRGASLVVMDKKGATGMGWMNAMAQQAPAMTGVVATTYLDTELVRAFWPIGSASIAAPTPSADGAGMKDELEDDVSVSDGGMGNLRADAATQSNFWRRVNTALAKTIEVIGDDEFSAPRFFGFIRYEPGEAADDEAEFFDPSDAIIE